MTATNRRRRVKRRKKKKTPRKTDRQETILNCKICSLIRTNRIRYCVIEYFFLMLKKKFFRITCAFFYSL